MRKPKVDLGLIAYNAVVYVTLPFLLLPIVVVVVASFTSGNYVTFPPEFPLSISWYQEFLSSDRYVPALQNSLIIGGLVVLVAGIAGGAAAIGWTHRAFRGREFVYYLILLPFVIPGLIIGIGMLMSFEPLGVSFLAGSRWAVVLGHSILAVPLVFIIMVGVLQGIDPNLVAAAKDLGARPFRTFLEVTLPLVRPGVMASFILAFITSFHEFIISLFLTAGGVRRTLPVEVWVNLRFEVSPVIAAIDAVMILSVIVALLLVARLVGIERIRLQ